MFLKNLLLLLIYFQLTLYFCVLVLTYPVSVRSLLLTYLISSVLAWFHLFVSALSLSFDSPCFCYSLFLDFTFYSRLISTLLFSCVWLICFLAVVYIYLPCFWYISVCNLFLFATYYISTHPVFDSSSFWTILFQFFAYLWFTQYRLFLTHPVSVFGLFLMWSVTILQHSHGQSQDHAQRENHKHSCHFLHAQWLCPTHLGTGKLRALSSCPPPIQQRITLKWTCSYRYTYSFSYVVTLFYHRKRKIKHFMTRR